MLCVMHNTSLQYVELYVLYYFQNTFEQRKKKHIWKKKRFEFQNMTHTHIAAANNGYRYSFRQEILFKYNEFSYFGTAVS